jgi:hypothetical protein
MTNREDRAALLRLFAALVGLLGGAGAVIVAVLLVTNVIT